MQHPGCVSENVALASMTTFAIGGNARWFAAPTSEREIAEVMAFAQDHALDIRILGGGSNVLIADAGFPGLVIRLATGGEFSQIGSEKVIPLRWRVGAAAPLQTLVTSVARAGVAGLESLAGIPGRVGGAIAMNAGAWEGGIGSYVVSARVVARDGSISDIPASKLQFSYRSSALTGTLALEFVLQFPKYATAESLLESMREFRQRKKASQPLGLPSAGCVFKNPANGFAGALLDQAGCKVMREGGAAVSQVHANFIVNLGGASSRDVATLAQRMREAVFQYSGIALESEILLWGEEPMFVGLRKVLTRAPGVARDAAVQAGRGGSE